MWHLLFLFFISGCTRYMPVIPALWRLRHEGHEFEASLGYIVRPVWKYFLRGKLIFKNNENLHWWSLVLGNFLKLYLSCLFSFLSYFYLGTLLTPLGTQKKKRKKPKTNKKHKQTKLPCLGDWLLSSMFWEKDLDWHCTYVKKSLLTRIVMDTVPPERC
jgi:hypothetical protein